MNERCRQLIYNLRHRTGLCDIHMLMQEFALYAITARGTLFGRFVLASVKD
jgi:hypothetical protein